MENTPDKMQIRTLIETWSKAINKSDVDGIVSNHTETILMFDVPPPLQAKGIEAYKKQWDLFISYQQEGGGFDIEDLEITQGDTVAFATSLLRIGGEQKASCRLTLGLIKADGKWLIAHEHHSAPHQPE